MWGGDCWERMLVILRTKILKKNNNFQLVYFRSIIMSTMLIELIEWNMLIDLTFLEGTSSSSMLLLLLYCFNTIRSVTFKKPIYLTKNHPTYTITFIDSKLCAIAIRDKKSWVDISNFFPLLLYLLIVSKSRL